MQLDYKEFKFVGKLEKKDPFLIAENTILLNPDIKYLHTALKSNYFFVPPDLLSETFQLKRLKSFEIVRHNPYMIEYYPIVEDFSYRFPETIQKINSDKFYKKYGVKFDERTKNYCCDSNDSLIKNQYGKFFFEDLPLINKDHNCNKVDDISNEDSFPNEDYQ